MDNKWLWLLFGLLAGLFVVPAFIGRRGGSAG